MSEASVASFDLNAVAGDLRAAQRTRTPCAPLRNTYPGFSTDDAYTVQRLNTEYGGASGRRLVGRKIGLTSKAIQTQLGVDQPDFGALFADMSYGDSEEMAWEAFLQPRVEAEVAFVLGRDLTHAELCTLDVMRAVDHALPAVEVVDSRIADWDIRFVDTVADNASCGAFVTGTVPVRLADVDLRLCGVVIERRGDPVSVGAGAACLGHPLNATLWLARKMVELGTPLMAGDVILSGGLGPMVAAAPGDVFDTRISGLGSVRAVFAPQKQAAQ